MDGITVAKKANQIIVKSLERLKEEHDINNFKDIPTIFNNAAGMVNDNPVFTALLNVWMVSQATNIVFLLWRREIEHDDIEKEWRELPTTDEMMDAYEASQEPDRKEAEELETRRRAYMDKQHQLDIFKGVLNGQSKEEAEANYKEYQERMAKSLGA